MRTLQTVKPVLIFANPISGSGRGKSMALRIQRALDSAGVNAPLWLESPAEIKVENIPTDAAAIVVVGGDGTIRAVAQRLNELTGNSNPHTPPLLIVPLGTANLLGRHLGINWT